MYSMFFVVGVLALVLGVSVYILDRPATQTYFIPDNLSAYVETESVFGIMGNYLPTFLHAFSLCLLTIAALKCTQRGSLLVCIFWLLIDGLFEVAQHQQVSQFIIPVIPDWFANFPILENAQNYFTHGNFDPLDLLSILIGVLGAYLMFRVFSHDLAGLGSDLPFPRDDEKPSKPGSGRSDPI